MTHMLHRRVGAESDAVRGVWAAVYLGFGLTEQISCFGLCVVLGALLQRCDVVQPLRLRHAMAATVVFQVQACGCLYNVWDVGEGAVACRNTCPVWQYGLE